jgi:hypothetical protein
MAEDLDALWAQAKPIGKPKQAPAAPAEDLDALWGQAKPIAPPNAPGLLDKAMAAVRAPVGAVTDSLDSDTGRAALHNYTQGFLKQWGDEGVGRLTQAAYKAADLAGIAPGAMNGPSGVVPVTDTSQVYDASVKNVRDELAQDSDAHPVASFLGNVGGEMASDFLLSKLGIPVASTPYAIAAGAVSGAGAADENTPGGRLGGAGMGAGLGAVGSAFGHYVAGPAISKLGGPLVKALGRKLEDLGIDQGRRALLNGADQLSRKITRSDAVREALRFGANGELPAILPLGTAKGALKRLEGRADTLDALRESILSRLEANGVKGADARKLADDLMERGGKDFVNSGADKSIAQKYMDEAVNVDQLAQDGQLGLKQGENIKRTLQKEAKYDSAAPDSRMNVARKDIAAAVRQANEDAVDAAGKAAPFGSEVSDLAESFVPVKQRLGRTLAAMEAAEKGAQRGSTRSWGGLALRLAKNPAEAGMALASGGGMMNRLASTAASGLFGSGAVAQGVGAGLSRLPPQVVAELGSVLGRDFGPDLLARLLRARDRQPEPGEQ